MTLKVAILAQFPVHVLPEFAALGPPAGHYATWLPQLAEAFAGKEELEIHWIALSADIEQRREARLHGQTFHVLPTARSGRATTLFKADRAAIDAALAEVRPDLAHGWGTEDVYGLSAVRGNRPSVVSMQGILSNLALRSILRPREYLQAALELYVLRKADRVTTESEWGRRIVNRIAPNTPVDLVEYGVQRHFMDCKWRPDPSTPSAVFIGTITPRKGIQDAVAAFRDARLAGAELWVFGEGEDAWAEKLRAHAPPNVKWHGRVSPIEIADRLARAWCLVLPTRADTSPNAVKEARVIGLPVITTPCGGQTTYIRENRCGFLVEPGKPKELADRLADLLTDLERARRTGAIDHEEHRRLLHPDRTADGFLEVYRKTARAVRHGSPPSKPA